MQLNMSKDEAVDYYEVLQISPNAEPDTVHRVYRYLAQQMHPDNAGTGDAARFRAVHQAYSVLSDPEKRAQYDVVYHQRRNDRWRLVSKSVEAQTDPSGTGNDFDLEQIARMTVLEVLYTRRRMEPRDPGIFDLDLEGLTGRPREHLEFTLWYLSQKKLIQRGDNSRLTITAEGIDCLEQNLHENLTRKRLKAAQIPEPEPSPSGQPA
jgi:curved DNA-binding protein CbpA